MLSFNTRKAMEAIDLSYAYQVAYTIETGATRSAKTIEELIQGQSQIVARDILRGIKSDIDEGLFREDTEDDGMSELEKAKALIDILSDVDYYADAFGQEVYVAALWEEALDLLNDLYPEVYDSWYGRLLIEALPVESIRRDVIALYADGILNEGVTTVDLIIPADEMERVLSCPHEPDRPFGPRCDTMQLMLDCSRADACEDEMLEVAEFLQEFSSDGLVIELASDFAGYVHNRRERAQGMTAAEREELAKRTCDNLIDAGFDPAEAEEATNQLKHAGACKMGYREDRLADYRAAIDEGLRRYKEHTFSPERWEDGGAPSLSDWYRTAPMM